MMRFLYSKDFLAHLFRRYRNLVLVTAVVVSALLYFVRPDATSFTWLDGTVTYATLAVAIFVWFGEAHEEWSARLPKRLTVVFAHEGDDARKPPQPVLVCKDAYLADEGDIRAWGQQIGRQLAGGALKFDPFIQQDRLGHRKIGGRLHNCYKVTFILRDLSEPRSLAELVAKDEAICWQESDLPSGDAPKPIPVSKLPALD